MVIVERKTLGLSEFVLGRCGENNVLQFRIDISGFVKKYGEGNAVIAHKRSKDSTPYDDGR